MLCRMLLLVLFCVACGDDDLADSSPGDASRDGARDAGRDGASEDATVDALANVDARDDVRDGGLACALPAAFDRGVTYARTLHVAEGASGDGSEAMPFGTVAEALDAATPSTRILVRAGTYGSMFLSDVRGEPGRPIAIVGDGEVVFEAGSAEVLHLVDPRYLVLENLTLRGSASHGINIDDGGSYETPAEFLVIRGITIASAGSGGNNDCIKLSGLDDFWIEDSDIGGCDRGESIDMVGCHRGVISGNHFRTTVGNGVQTKGGSADMLITANLFEDIPGRAVNAGGSTGLEFFRPSDAPHEAARIRVVANVFLRGGTESGAPIAFVGCDGCQFVHNTVITPEGGWIARILQETTGARFTPSRNGLVANNLYVLNVDALRTFVNVGADTAPETFTFANNLWFALDRDDFGGPTLPSEIPAEAGAVVQEDPLLVDRAGGDFSLSAGSPAIGAALAMDDLTPGYDGRCFSNPAAIGALPAP